MSRESIVQRQLKREKLVNRLETKREEYKAKANDVTLDIEERLIFQKKLQKLSKNSSKVRLRNRCSITGRPRGVYRKFGLARNKLRELAMQGVVPGLTKASW